MLHLQFEKIIKSALFLEIGKLYIFVLYHPVPIFCLSQSYKSFFSIFFVEHKKKLNAHAFVPSTCPEAFKQTGKGRPKWGIWSLAFPSIKRWLNGSCFRFDPLRTWHVCVLFSDWTTVCRKWLLAYCCHLWPRVLSAFPNLSQGIQCIYLLTTFSPVDPLFLLLFCLTNIPPMS